MANNREISVQQPSVETYTNATPMPSTVGGWSAGSTFSNKTTSQMFDGLLYPYQLPVFSTLTLTGVSTPLEVGATVAANPTFNWSVTNYLNILASSIVLKSAGVTVMSGISSTGASQTQATVLAAITKTTATTSTFSIDATNTNSQALATKSYVVTWQWKRYYGESVSTPLNEAGIEGLRVGGLASGFAGTYIFNALSSGYKYLCYPSVLGAATIFKDTSTQLPVPFEAPYTVSVTNSYGVATNYNVHRSTNILSGAITIIVS